MKYFQLFISYRELVKYPNFKILILTTFLESFGFSYFVWYTSIYVYEIGRETLVAYSYSLIMALRPLLSILSGSLSDCIGRKKIIIAGATLMPFSIFSLFLGHLFNSKVFALFSIILVNIIFVVKTTPLNVLIMDSLPEEFLGRAFSLLPILDVIGFSMGQLCVGYIVNFIKIEIVFLLSFFIFIITLPIYFKLSEKSVSIGKLSPSAPLRGLHECIGLILSSKLLILYIVYRLSDVFISSLSSPFTTIYLWKILGINLSELSYIYALISFSEILGEYTAGIIVDKLNPIQSLMIQEALCIPLLILFALGNIEIVIMSLLLGVILGKLNVAGLKYIAMRVKSKKRGTFMGLLPVIYIPSRTIAPIIGSMLWSISPRILYMSSGILLMIPLFILYLLSKSEGKVNVE